MRRTNTTKMEKNYRPLFAVTKEEFLEILDSRYEKKETKNFTEIRKDELLTLTEVCALFKKTRQTIRNWVKRKLICVVVVGGSNFYSKIEIENFLNKKFKTFSINLKK